MERIGFIRNEDEKHEENYKGTPVKVFMQGGSAIGYMSKQTYDKTILCPTLIYEPFFDEEGKEKPHYRIERNIPVAIETKAVQGISPISEEFINRLLKINESLI